jgi:hypothetical protein
MNVSIIDDLGYCVGATLALAVFGYIAYQVWGIFV